MFSSPSFRQGLRDSILIFLAVGAFGVAYGVLALEVGFAPWLAIVSSAVIVSGAAQFAMVGLLGSGAGAIPVLVAATGLGLRHLPMAATLNRLIGPRPAPTRLRLAFVLVDETFGLTLRAADSDVDDLVAYKTAADALLLSGLDYWHSSWRGFRSGDRSGGCGHRRSIRSSVPGPGCSDGPLQAGLDRCCRQCCGNPDCRRNCSAGLAGDHSGGRGSCYRSACQ